MQSIEEITGFIFVLNNEKYFEEIKVMINNIKQKIKNDYQMIICANINSLENHRLNLSKETVMYIINQKIDLIEIDSKNGYNINLDFI